MQQRGKKRFGTDERGAVAATYALSLTALIAVAGVGFDYARLASMDSELQNAADEAALAGATQLDGSADAITNATKAASGPIDGSGNFVAGSALAENDTLSANDVSERRIAVPTVLFYETKANAEAGTSPTTDPTLAHFVRVIVETRAANYALTPIVGQFFGQLNAEAVAGLGSAICKTPPLMMCNPDEPEDNEDADYPFDATSRIGFGIRLVGNGSYEPGNFGFLQTGYGSGANALLKAIGWNTPPGDCLPQTGVTTQTGVDASVMDGFNTRFDVNANGVSCVDDDALCSPSLNVKKDLVRGNQCGITGNGWVENPASNSDFQTKRYKPTSATAYASTMTPQIMGHPRDICHAWSDDGDCGGVPGRRMGDGQWDIDAYWRANHGAASGSGYPTSLNDTIAASSGIPIPSGRTYPTRYQVYLWEMNNYTTQLGTHAGASSKTAYDKPVANTCLATSSPPYGIVPGINSIDRRRISAAVINCNAYGIAGHESNVPVLRWIDLFLVEPSISRTKCDGGAGCNTKYSDKTDLYVELIGETQVGAAGATGGQVVRRDVPYLIK